MLRRAMHRKNVEGKTMQDLSREKTFAELAIIGTKGCEGMLERISGYIGEWRKEEPHYIVEASFPRFGTGEAKGLIGDSVRCFYCCGLLQLRRRVQDVRQKRSDEP